MSIHCEFMACLIKKHCYWMHGSRGEPRTLYLASHDTDLPVPSPAFETTTPCIGSIAGIATPTLQRRIGGAHRRIPTWSDTRLYRPDKRTNGVAPLGS